MAMDFPIADLMDEQACYDRLVVVLHPHGLACPRCRAAGGGLRVHRRHRGPVLGYRCRRCGKAFNAFTGTPLSGTPKPPSRILLFLRGVAKGESTARLARELGCSRPHLLALRHRLQANAAAWLERFDAAPLPDPVVEADEMYQNAGEKACRTRTRPTRRGGGRTSGAGTGRGRTTARRCSGSSAGRPAGCGWRWCGVARGPSSSRGCSAAPGPGRR